LLYLLFSSLVLTMPTRKSSHAPRRIVVARSLENIPHFATFSATVGTIDSSTSSQCHSCRDRTMKGTPCVGGAVWLARIQCRWWKNDFDEFEIHVIFRVKSDVQNLFIHWSSDITTTMDYSIRLDKWDTHAKFQLCRGYPHGARQKSVALRDAIV
jgi:hypothetical protein